MAEVVLKEKEKAPGYRLDHPDFGVVYRVTHAKGVITDFKKIEDDPLKVAPLVKVKVDDEESDDYIPLFFRPKELYWNTENPDHAATDINEEGRFYENAWMSFRGDDEVKVMLVDGTPYAVLAFLDGVPRIGEDIVKADDAGTIDYYQMSHRKSYGNGDEGWDGLALNLKKECELISRGPVTEKIEWWRVDSAELFFSWQADDVADLFGIRMCWGNRVRSEGGCYGESEYHCTQDCVDAEKAWAEAQGIQFNDTILVDAFDLGFTYSYNSNKWWLVVQLVPVGPILYVVCGLWMDISYTRRQVYGGWDGGYPRPYDGSGVYKDRERYLDMIGQTYYNDPGLETPPNITWDTTDGYPFSGQPICAFSMVKAGVYSKKLVQKIKDGIASIDIVAAKNLADAPNNKVDWLPNFLPDELTLQTQLTTDWILINWRDLTNNHLYVRPHTKAELQEAKLWPI
jgi:hypothetical protein